MNEETLDKYEDPEGEDAQSLDEGMGDYPLDTMLVRSEVRTAQEVIKRIEDKRYIMNPEFQRDFIWDKKKESRLIESCLMRIPLPVFYFAENENGSIVVVDGLQRLTTLKEYIENKFKLHLAGSPLNNKKFSDLSVKLQERIEDAQLRLYILDPKAPEQARLDIFERVNGGVSLTKQQMRNCLYSGSATRWLYDAAKYKEFLQATSGTLRPKLMKDREAINRFCAFRILGVEAYPGNMDQYLANALIKMNKMNEDDLNEMKDAFKQSMENNYTISGKHAFRKSTFSNYNYMGTARTLINISLFDALSVVLADIDVNKVKDNKDHFRYRMQKLGSDDEFLSSITLGTNSTVRVKSRHARIRDCLLLD